MMAASRWKKCWRLCDTHCKFGGVPETVNHPLAILTVKTIHVTVKLCINDNADPFETIEWCDYTFTHEDIIDTEIVNVCDENNVDVF